MSCPHSRGSIVLMYHRMGSPFVRSIVRQQYVLPGLFRRQLTVLLSRGYQPLTLADMLSRPEHSTNHFSVTFDDGYANVGSLAYPVLTELGVRCTIFVVSGTVGKTNEWDERVGDRTERMLTRTDLLDLAAAGMEIGSHTVTHAHLARLSDADLRRELRDSKAALEDMLGREVAGMSYPYGDWDERVRQAVAEAGYRYAAITAKGCLTPRTDPFAIPRLNMRWNTTGPWLMHKIREAYRQ